MAIHDKFEVRVFVKGEPVHEYDGPENCTDPLADGKKAHRKPGPVVKRCIESVPGENFAIELKTNQGFDLKPRQALSFVIEVDGKIANGTIATKKVYDSGSGWMHTVEGASDCNRGIWQLRKFRFQNLHTDTVPSNEKLDARKVAKIGSIRVRVRRVKLIKQGAPELKEDDRGKSQITVSERHLKGQAIDSQTGFDAPEEVSENTLWDTKYLEDAPLVTFNFRHYTRNGLKSLGIISEPERPDPFELLDPEKLSQEECLRLFSIGNAGLQHVQKKIKQEDQPSSSSSGSNKRARIAYDTDELEEIPPPAPRPTPQNGGRID